MATASVMAERARRALKINEQRKADRAEALRLKDRGMSNVTIAYHMQKSEATVRQLLKEE